MDKTVLTRVLGGGAALFGATALVAPKSLGALYGVAPDGYRLQMWRLWGSRNLAVALYGLTARPGEERDRALLISGAICAVDTLTSLASRRTTSARTALGGAATSGAFAAALFAARAMADS